MGDQVEEPKSKFWWLWHNKLFENTPLTGYAFIHGAKRLSEVIVWYGLIILFTGFTANNIRNLINRYNSHPTRTEVLIGSNTTDATIKNFTLKLKLPISEIYESIVQWGDLNMGPTHELTFQQSAKILPFLCDKARLLKEFVAAPFSASHCLLLSLYPLIKNYDTELLDYTSHLAGSVYDGRHCKTNVNLTHLNQPMMPTADTEHILKKLKNLYGDKLTAAWNKSTDTNHPDHNFKRSINVFMRDYQENPQREGFKTVYLALYLLHAAISQSESLQNNLPFLSRINTTKFFETSGLSAEDAIDIIANRLLNIAPFELPPELNATRVVLREWDIEFRDKKITDEQDSFIFKNYTKQIPAEISAGYNLFGESFTQEYLVLLPDGIKEVTIDIFPPKKLIEALFVIMHFDQFIYELGLIQVEDFLYANPLLLDFHLKLIDCKKVPMSQMLNGITDTAYDYEEYVHQKPRKRFLETFFDPLLDLYSSYSELQLDTGSGYITMTPFASYEIKYLPIGRVISETDICTSMDFTECFEICQTNYSLKNCHCIPWNLKYLQQTSQRQICHQPCPGLQANRDACGKECESTVAHPCDQFTYRPEIVTHRSTRKSLEEDSVIPRLQPYRKALTNRFKLFKLKINVEQVITYSKTKESYEMSFTTFISEFGGLVDFWLGVDVIGIIHAIMYLIKQFFHCGPSHKTGRTVRRLFGREKIHQLASDG